MQKPQSVEIEWPFYSKHNTTVLVVNLTSLQEMR